MTNFETTLLREKFTISDNNSSNNTSLIALSNRIACPLYNRKGELVEEFIIRGQTIYSCARMLSRLIQAFHVGGSLINRTKEFKWDRVWDACTSDYEKKYNPDKWIAVYHNGRVIFEDGERHPFVDMIEKFAYSDTKRPYEDSLNLAEKAFKQTGKDLSVHHDANVALIINKTENSIRCGTILRSANRTTTFSFTATLPKDDKFTSMAPFISAAAAHTEAVQICFIVGMLTAKEMNGEIERGSDEAKKLREARQRLAIIQSELSNVETSFKINYRPEKPNFRVMIEQAKMSAEKMVS